MGRASQARQSGRDRRPQSPAAGRRTEDTNQLEPLGDKWRAFGWEVVAGDGHDHAALYALSFRAPGKPRCVIANTIKGKGVSFIEDRVEWHQRCRRPEQVELALKELRDECTRSTTPADLRLPRRLRGNADRAGASVDERIVAVCNDSVGSSNLGGFQKLFPDRLINVGIAEQNMVGVAAGLANGGFIPFVCGAGPFLTGRALEQIKVDVAYNGFPVVLCGMSPGMAYGELGPTHHSIEDLSWLRAIDGLAIVVPADPAQTRAAVRWAAAAGSPCYIRVGRTRFQR